MSDRINDPSVAANDAVTVIDERDSKQAEHLSSAQVQGSWFLGTTYAVFVGPSLFLSGLQASLIHLLFALLCAWFTRIRQHTGQLAAPAVLYTCIATIGLNSISFAVNDNTLIILLNWLVQLFFGSFVLITLARDGRPPQTVMIYVRCLFTFFAAIPIQFFFGGVLSRLFAYRTAHKSMHYDDKRGLAIVVVLLLLAFSHAMFSQINEDYARGMQWVFNLIWQAVKYLYDMDIITLICVSSAVSVLFYCACAARLKASAPVDSKKYIELKYLSTVLSPLIILFFTFSVFQVKTLFLDYQALSYKELSLYVQKGFWELLCISFVGGAVYCTIMERMCPTARASGKGRLLLIVFALELLLLTVFSHHKLIIQQALFGLRDRRVIASLGVILLSLSFICYLLQALGRMSAEKTFSIQYWGMAIIVLFVSAINLEQRMLSLHPIRFSLNGTVYKDYAYLFTNSTDSAASWLALMDEAERTGIPVPKDYYWIGATGGYQSLCRSGPRGAQLPSTFDTLIDGLHQKYGSGAKKDLRSTAKFNLSDYRAYLLVKAHPERVKRFSEFILRECNRDWSSLRSVLNPGHDR